MAWSSELVWLESRSSFSHSSTGPPPARISARAVSVAAWTASTSQPSTRRHCSSLSTLSARGVVRRVGVLMPKPLSSTMNSTGSFRSCAKHTAS